jgi:hypothetical protein
MSDNLYGFPVEKRESTIVPPQPSVPLENGTTQLTSQLPRGTVADEALLYTDQAIYQYGQHGPFNQTLFLGCSVVNFNANLGWGGEASSLTVSLVEDDTPHPNSPTWDQNNNAAVVSNDLARNLPFNDVATRSTFLRQSTTDYLNIAGVTPEIPTTVPDLAINNPNISPDLHRNILLQEQHKKQHNDITNARLSLATPNRADFGKVYYDLQPTGNIIKRYWTGRDPGFVGESYDILGVAVRFIFNDFEFAGIVTSWKNNGGSGGKNLYTVEIKSFATLLKNTQLIIDYYPGTIFSQADSIPGPFTLLDKFGFPCSFIGDRVGPAQGVEALESEYTDDHFQGKIAEGGLPNVFNIYGYLQAVRGWGKSDISENGTLVKDVLLGIENLVNKSEPPSNNIVDKPLIIDARFSPYGRIVGKAPALIKQDGIYKNIPSATIRFLKDKYEIVDPLTHAFKGLKERDIAQAQLQSGSVTVAEQFLQDPQYAENRFNSTGGIMTLSKMGIIPTSNHVDTIHRQYYTLDLSALPSVPDDYTINGPIISVIDLIQNVCDANNFDYFIDFDPQTRNTIKVRTISRQKQPPNNYIAELIKNTENNNILTSYDYGIEFNDEATLRSMYIGAKQKRLLQLNSNFLSRKNNSLLFDPKIGDIFFHTVDDVRNTLRSPDHILYRNPAYSYYNEFNNIPPTLGSGTGCFVSTTLGTTYSNSDSTTAWNWGTNVGRGNYGHEIKYVNNSQDLNIKNSSEDVFKDLARSLFQVTGSEPIIVGSESEENIGNRPILNNYALWDDFICPYFGLDIDGTARKVYFDNTMQQIQVLCSVGDIQNILGFAITQALNLNAVTTKQEDDARLPSDPLVSGTDPSTFTGNDVGRTTREVLTTFQQGETVATFHTKWNVRDRSYYDVSSKFLILENEIRAAMAGFESWVYYTFNKNFTTDLGVMLRYTMVSPTGLIVQESTVQENPPISSITNKGEPVVSMVFHGPDPHLIGDNAADSPNSSASLMNDRVSDMLQKVHSYVKNIGDTYYGKQFMVKIPGLSISRDRPSTSNKQFDAIYRGVTANVEEFRGVGTLYSNYKPATDGAWEEPGNIIDDTILIGSVTGDFFTNEDGRFGAILGYKASYEFLNDTIPDETIDNATKPDNSQTSPTAQRSVVLDKNNRVTNYTSFSSGNIPESVRFNKVGDIKNAITSNLPASDQNEQSPSANPPSMAIILAQSSQPATGIDVIPNEWYPSLITSLSNSEFLYYPYNFGDSYPSVSQLADVTFANINHMQKTAYGYTVPVSNTTLHEHLQYKLYAKASIEDNFIFIRTDEWLYNSSSTNNNPNYREPRAIVTLSSPVECNPVHIASKYVHHCLMLDSTLFKVRAAQVSIPIEVASSSRITGTIVGGLLPYNGGFSKAGDIVTNATDHFLDALNAVDKDANKAVTMPIAPKAAMPGFAAVPLESQAAVYGPWINYPWMVRKDIFTHPDISENPNYIKDAIENLVGGLKVQVVEELCPWKYGSIKNLDMEAIARVENDSNYQITQEYGNVSIPGSPIYKLGDFLDTVSERTSGPIINSIRSNIGDGGVSTEYSLRTFTRKFGLFNKENASRAAQVGAERISRRRAIALQAAEVTNRRAAGLRSQNLNDAPTRDYNNPPLPESWRSSSELLVGHNDINVRMPLNLRNSPDQGVVAMSGMLNYDARWGFTPTTTGEYNITDYPKIFSNTQILDNREALNQLESSYENTSFMSLDGLLSPISFYPTENFRTYHISKYPRKSCRYCFGKGKLKYNFGMAGLYNTITGLNAGGLSGVTPAQSQASSESSIDCPFCEAEEGKIARLLTGTKRGRVTPPFIMTTGLDPSGGVAGSNVYRTLGTVINYSTLNPVVLTYGEFSNFQNRQTGDNTANSIRMVGLGAVPPNKASDSLNQMYASDNRLYKSHLDYDQLYLDKIKELHAIPENKRSENIKKLIQKLPANITPFSNNARFFGLRGPIMVHGWGYDTEGYPVPNASGEVQTINGRVVRATGQTNQNYVVPVYKNQIFVRTDEESGNENNPNNVLNTNNKVIVNNPTGEGYGYYTDPYRESTFAKGWAQMPSTWPVGPIDLRWDSSAKVWTFASEYKNVYILLEEDLTTKNTVARGEIIDNAQDIDNKILALNFRKAVFVKDNMGIYAAPKSSIIYCAYDEDGGFYEPVSQNSFVSSGNIISSNTANMYKLFYRKRQSLGNNLGLANEPNQYIAKFSNPLGFRADPGNMGLFAFTKDGWILQSNGR